MTTHTPLRCAFSVMAGPDSSGHAVLMDTGAYPGTSSFLNETWTFNGTTPDWTNTGTTLIDANGPLPGRLNHVMASDGTNIMLYGGQGGSSTAGVLQDTWVWNAGAWTKHSPATVPFGRHSAQACRLTTASSHILMFGGFGGSGNGVFLNETWDWDGTNWTLEAPATSPSARIGHCMAGGASLVVMFGGQGTNQLFNDTWTYNGSTWSKLAPAAAPSARTGACMAYDVANANWVLFGGMNEYYRLPETWTFNGTTWTQHTPTTSPAGLTGAQMCYDANHGSVIMFGGFSATDNYASDQTWSWSGTNWTLL